MDTRGGYTTDQCRQNYVDTAVFRVPASVMSRHVDPCSYTGEKNIHVTNSTSALDIADARTLKTAVQTKRKSK